LNSRFGYVSSGTWNGTITAIRTSTGQALSPIRVGHNPQAMAITPDGRTAYVMNAGSGTVTPIRVATCRALRPIKVGLLTDALDMAPDGKVIYAVDPLSVSIASIHVATNKVGRRIRIGYPISAIAFTPDSRIAYVAARGGILVPVRTAAGRRGKDINIHQVIEGIAVAP
jgi:YVTN family beta-propeller protein